MTALPTVGEINYPSAQDIRDGALRTMKLGLARVGINLNTLPGSDPFVRAEAWARRAVIAFANNRIRYADLSPLTATGQNLIDVAAMFGVAKRPASRSTGYVRIVCTGTVTIPAGYRATAPNGETYDTITAATLTTGGVVEVRSVNTGLVTRQDATTRLTWQSAAIGTMAITCVVAAGGLDGGADEDSEDTLRRRLLDKLANPAGGGNTAQVRQLAEDSTAAIERAYVYNACRGPATTDVAVTAEGGDRTLSDATVAIAAAALQGLPGHADINVTSVLAQPVDVLLLATLPLPQSAGGAGGGWVDGTPWPRGTPVAAANDGKVTAYAAGVATVRVTSAVPQVGQRIGVWDPADQEMNEYTIASVGGVSGAYTITVQGLEGAAGFKVSPLACYVSAGAASLSLYAATFLAQCETFGPGEKTESDEALPRARRQPVVSSENPRDLDNRILGALQAAHTELEASYGLRLDNVSGSARTAPSVPVNAISPPRILTLKNFAMWRAP